MHIASRALLLLHLILAGQVLGDRSPAQSLPTIPRAKEVVLGDGELSLGASPRVLCRDPGAAGVGELLAEDLGRVFGDAPQVVRALDGRARDVVLGVDSAVDGNEEAYRLSPCRPRTTTNGARSALRLSSIRRPNNRVLLLSCYSPTRPGRNGAVIALLLLSNPKTRQRDGHPLATHRALLRACSVYLARHW